MKTFRELREARTNYRKSDRDRFEQQFNANHSWIVKILADVGAKKFNLKGEMNWLARGRYDDHNRIRNIRMEDLASIEVFGFIPHSDDKVDIIYGTWGPLSKAMDGWLGLPKVETHTKEKAREYYAKFARICPKKGKIRL